MHRSIVWPALAGALLLFPIASPAQTPSPDATQDWSLHAQFTNVTQYHPAFHSAYEGPNSMTHEASARETTDITGYLGRRLWRGAAVYADPEIDEGFGLSQTLGAAGFPSGEAYKVGKDLPYFRLPRAFVRQYIDVGGEGQGGRVEEGANQLPQEVAAENLTLTIGKFSVVDIVDTNRYAHDPRADFLNWSVIEGGAFDYAADPWGFSYGAAAEWTRSWWTLRSGFFALSREPNSHDIDTKFGQYEWVLEFEERHAWGGRPGAMRVLAFDNHGRMARYRDAVALARSTGTAADASLVRHYNSRAGLSVNFEQEMAADLGAFARAGWNEGSKEVYEFTEINRSISLGLSLGGARWDRSGDRLGIAAAVNGLSRDARAYFAAGGMGLLIGDGNLRYGLEHILETYYAWRVGRYFTLTGDFQWIQNPAYNRDRGPVPVVGLRLHNEF